MGKAHVKRTNSRQVRWSGTGGEIRGISGAENGNEKNNNNNN